MGRVTIHCEPAIAWQPAFAAKLSEGLTALGIEHGITASRARESDIAILLGTTCWRQIEGQGDFLLIDRCSFHNTNEWVSLVWNGHGRRGFHATQDDGGRRWRQISCGVKPWSFARQGKIILCGQIGPTNSDQYPMLENWYRGIKATHFRRHPCGANPTMLPEATTWDDVRRVITLNSSVGVETVMAGIPTVTMDAGAMAWDVTSHDPAVGIRCNRDDWLHWLAWTQWHHDEIRAGLPIRHIFEGFL